MAGIDKLFYRNIDLLKNQLKNVTIHNITDLNQLTTVGQIGFYLNNLYYKDSNDVIKINIINNTNDVTEGDNLYFTENRVLNTIVPIQNIILNNNSILESFTFLSDYLLDIQNKELNNQYLIFDLNDTIITSLNKLALESENNFNALSLSILQNYITLINSINNYKNEPLNNIYGLFLAEDTLITSLNKLSDAYESINVFNIDIVPVYEPIMSGMLNTILNQIVGNINFIANDYIVNDNNIILKPNVVLSLETLSNFTIDGNINIGNLFTTANVINIGTGINSKIINIGSDNDTVNIKGNVLYETVTNLYVKDKLITLNSGGINNSQFGSGLEFESDNLIKAYLKLYTNGFTFNNGFDVNLDLSQVTQTRTLTVPNQSGTIALAESIGGKFGISNSNGIYTYYTTLQAAIDAAVAGQTVEVFADYIETGNVTIILKDGVNINGNGHSYTLNYTSLIGSVFSDNSSKVDCQIINYKINSINNSSNFVLSINNTLSKIDLSSSLLYNDMMDALTNFGTVMNANLRAFRYGARNAGFIYNSIGETIGNQNTSGIINLGGSVSNCTGISLLGSGFGLSNDAGMMLNSVGISNSADGISNGQTLINSTGYSTGRFGISNTGSLISCNGYSTANRGISNSGLEVSNCYAFSSANYALLSLSFPVADIRGCTAISTAQTAIFCNSNVIKCIAITKLNNPGAHALIVDNDNVDVFNNYLEVTNPNSNAINSNGNMRTIRFGHNEYKNTTIPVAATITQGQINPEDAFGNILIG